MIQIPKNEILEVLKHYYTSYKSALKEQNELKCQKIQAHYRAFEKIITIYSEETIQEMQSLKKEILGIKEFIKEVDLDEPTFMREKVIS